MYSSTEWTSSTIPIDNQWAQSITSGDISLHPSEYNYLSAEFNDDFLKHLTKPTILPEKQSLKKIDDEDSNCSKVVTSRCVDEVFKRELGQKCEDWDSIRSRLRNEAEDRKQLTQDFLLSKQPWYIPRNQQKANELDPLKKYYCFPKVCVELDHHFVHYKKIIEFMKNGIYIFLIDLSYGTDKKKLKVLRHIERARQFCDAISSIGTTIAIGFQIGNRFLKTGLVKRNRDVFIDEGSKVILTSNRKYSDCCSHRVIYANFKDYRKRLSKNDLIEIGKRIKLKVLKILRESLYCRVVQEGLLTSQMPLKLPIECTLEPIDITTEEEEDCDFAINRRPDFIVCPSVYKPKLINHIRWMMASHEWEVNTFAKISMSNDFLFKDIDHFMSEYTGIWMQDYPFKCINLFQYIIDKCMCLNKLLVRSLTFKSENMKFDEEDKTLKQRLFLYADCISTPITGSINPINMKYFIRKNYPQMNEDNLSYSCKYFLQSKRSIEHIFHRYAFYSSLIEQVTCIIILNNSGKSVAALSRKRPLVPIIANLCDVALTNSMMLLKNVYPMRHFGTFNMTWIQELEARFDNSFILAKNLGFIKPNEPFMVCYDTNRGGKFSDAYRILYAQ